MFLQQLAPMFAHPLQYSTISDANEAISNLFNRARHKTTLSKQLKIRPRHLNKGASGTQIRRQQSALVALISRSGNREVPVVEHRGFPEIQHVIGSP